MILLQQSSMMVYQIVLGMGSLVKRYRNLCFTIIQMLTTIVDPSLVG
jgi:hypothetical protein